MAKSCTASDIKKIMSKIPEKQQQAVADKFNEFRDCKSAAPSWESRPNPLKYIACAVKNLDNAKSCLKKVKDEDCKERLSGLDGAGKMAVIGMCVWGPGYMKFLEQLKTIRYCEVDKLKDKKKGKKASTSDTDSDSESEDEDKKKPKKKSSKSSSKKAAKSDSESEDEDKKKPKKKSSKSSSKKAESDSESDDDDKKKQPKKKSSKSSSSKKTAGSDSESDAGSKKKSSKKRVPDSDSD